MTDKADPARTAAFDTLQAVSRQDAYANLVLPRLLTEAGLSGRDAALATELGYGTLRASGTLDEVLRRCASRPLADIEPAVLNLLRLGAYQLLRTRIASHAAVATTVDLARSTGNARAAGFVNAVLRKVAVRDFERWCDEIAGDASAMGRLAIRYSHPGWIVAAFAEALDAGALDVEALDVEVLGTGALDAEVLGTEASQSAGSEVPGAAVEYAADPLVELEAALAADDARPETHLVGWPGRINQAALVEQSGGEPGRWSPYAVRLTGGGEPAELAAIGQGQAGVQDEGSQLCARALAELPLTGSDRHWLDLCAGPGGKAALLAALVAERGGWLTAGELHPHRAALVERATAGWPVTVVTGDARQLPSGAGNDGAGYDRVLLDAPCTGLGALRRRPEARWRRGPADLAELVELQAELLDAAVRLVRPGGVIGYVTCSPHLAETDRQVQAALRRHPGLELLDARPAFAGLPGLTGPTVQLWPHRHGTDAMYFAGLRRTS